MTDDDLEAAQGLAALCTMTQHDSDDDCEAERSLWDARGALTELAYEAERASSALDRACRLAGVRATAAATGLAASTVQRWRTAIPVQPVIGRTGEPLPDVLRAADRRGRRDAVPDRRTR